MKKISGILLMAVLLLALQACSSKEDEPDFGQIDPDSIAGVWFASNLKGWEYDSDAPGGKVEFNESFRYNEKGQPLGLNAESAVGINLTRTEVYGGAPDTYYFTLESCVWVADFRTWALDETDVPVILKGNKLTIDSETSEITSLTETSMTLHEKNQDGEAYVTFIRL